MSFVLNSVHKHPSLCSNRLFQEGMTHLCYLNNWHVIFNTEVGNLEGVVLFAWCFNFTFFRHWQICTVDHINQTCLQGILSFVFTAHAAQLFSFCQVFQLIQITQNTKGWLWYSVAHTRAQKFICIKMSGIITSMYNTCESNTIQHSISWIRHHAINEVSGLFLLRVCRVRETLPVVHVWRCNEVKVMRHDPVGIMYRFMEAEATW